MAIFPTGAPNMSPSEKTTTSTAPESIGRSFIFNFKTGQFLVQDGQIKETTEIQALEQWIELCLRTYKDKFKVYDSTGFGCNIEDIVGNKLTPFYASELNREITESLLKNNQIKNVTKIGIIQEGKSIKISIIAELTNRDTLVKEVVL